jgi:hypothetical protein
LFLNFHLLSQMVNRKISRIQNKKSESNFSLLWNRRPLKSRISEIACSALTSKVSNNPTESTFVAAEKIEVLILYACDRIIICQAFITLGANTTHYLDSPG